MIHNKPSGKMPFANDAVRFATRDLIVMHLYEAARLSGKMKEQIDIKLFNHLIGMALYAAQEGRDDDGPPETRMHLHS